jgi:hypothetical protein
MELTPEQSSALDRLAENESLTDNLTDEPARALLDWAQQQILKNFDSQIVTAAVSAANQEGDASAQTVVNRASKFLSQAIRQAEGASGAARTASSDVETASERKSKREHKPEKMGAVPSPLPTTDVMPATQSDAAVKPTAEPILAAASSAQTGDTSPLDTSVPPTAKAPSTKKTRRPRKTKKKKSRHA